MTTESPIFQRLYLHMTSGATHQYSPRIDQVDVFLDDWMRVKLRTEPIPTKEWRRAVIWLSDAVVFLGNVESITWGEKVPL